MCTGLSEDLEQIDDTRKTALIDLELARLNIDIAALQETRLLSSGSLQEKNYTFFWQGKPETEHRLHGVGFAVKNSLLPSVEPPSSGTERILRLRLSTSAGMVNIFSIYAPTQCSPSEMKDQFYEDLNSTLDNLPSSEHLYLLGDFNARVGRDHTSWPICIGHFGIGKLNDNGQRLLEVCSHHGLCITNSFFQSKLCHKVSWRHPRSKHWHQLDLVVTKRSCLNSVLSCRSYHSADCNSDHSLVGSRVRLKPKKLHTSKQKCLPRINTVNADIPWMQSDFSEALQVDLASSYDKSLDAQRKWDLLRKSIYNTAIGTFGKKVRRNTDWFEANVEVMKPILEAKRTALVRYKENPTPRTSAILKNTKKAAQQAARLCANQYWLQLCRGIQHAADTGNVRGMYEGIKKALGPTVKKTAPLKLKNGEPITDREAQMDRWVEHYHDLYSTENVVTEPALNSIKTLPVMEELDREPTMDEVSDAIDALHNGKAPGSDNIPPEAIKCGKDVLCQHLHDFFCTCWKEGLVPQDLRDARITTLYKNKGERSDCNNYRGISLLSIIGKVLARIVLSRLQLLANRVYPESQCGFRAGRSTIDMIFSLRQIQEKCQEQNQPLFIVFIDLTKAFDLVSRKGLFTLLEKIGCPPTLLSIIKSFHDNMQGTVQYDGSTSKPFPIRSGVKQGCVLAPTLFGIFFSLLLSYAFDDCSDGIYLHTRSDGKLFNLSRLRATTKIRRILVREMLFADDAALVAHTKEALQHLMNKFSHACKEFGLTISLKKTNVMCQGVEETPSIVIDDHSLEVVDSFTYLGATISKDLSVNNEINKRIGKASTVMARLKRRVWENKKLTLNTKIRIYEACVLSTLLYSIETCSLYASQERRLNSFHLRCLRRIMSIKWEDRISNSDVLNRAKSSSIHGILSQRRLRWLGHVYRMDDGRLPKDILYGELATGARSVGRPKLRYKDVCKRDMKSTDIKHDSWEALAANRAGWKTAVEDGIRTSEEKRQEAWNTKREARKQRTTSSSSSSSSQHVCSKCSRDCHSGIGLFSHFKKCSKS